MKKYIYIALSVCWLMLCRLEVIYHQTTLIPRDYIGYLCIGLLFVGLSIKSVIEEL